ncbi:MAG: 50S ribosomal protein L3 [Firmicutes bacterium]|nr:50S ribosomal protein L3 [Bacillota bacterium]MDD4263015.1 50S ribosomal protein L3 [Bacillota bacterium]MDD4693336.1 50S ribosomal protein L3 [Bacillota bacterium]
MPKAILGKKIGMTQIFAEDGTVIPVTVIEAGPCKVAQVKTDEIDGYKAVQLAFGDIKEQKANKPLKGHYKKADLTPSRYLREVELEENEEVKVGDVITADLFKEGDVVDVTGTSKGRGYSGVIKKYNFRIGPKGHGSKYHRGVGSLGAIDPARIFKGRPMPSRWGTERVTIQNLAVVKVDAEKNLLLIKGSVPGIRGSLVTVRKAVKA